MREELRGTVLSAAEDVAGAQRRLAPYEHLQAAIKVSPAERRADLYNDLRSKRTIKDPELAAIIHVDAMDAAWVEFGTPPHTNEGRFPGTLNPGVPPRPYFFPGYRANKKRALSKINKAARKVLREGFK